MWGKKKPDTRQAADAEPTNLQTNQPPKPASAAWDGTTKMNKDVMHLAGETADRAPSRLGSSLHVKGEISGNEDLDIDGTVEGLVHIDEGKLTVGATVKLTADIIAGEVIVYGTVKGNVRAKGKIEIKKDGSVNGDLTTPQIIIEDGAYFKGSIEIEQRAEKEGNKNVFSRTASASAAPAAGAEPRSIYPRKNA
jgi:cytoskeletal protein CcmA (bactofilin family)